MAGSDPLLVPPRPSSDNSSAHHDEEVDGLLTGQRADRAQDRGSHRPGFWREIGLFVWGLVATVAVIFLAVAYQHHQQTSGTPSGNGLEYNKPTGKRNFIFMVSDGMGPTSLSLTRSFRQHTEGLPLNDVLVLDKHHIGTSRTRSTSSLVTDSAAGATAFSCALKSYNGAISVLPDHTPCGTVLEAAKDAGYMTGLVVTTRITDATPACFASHANMRSYEDLIAEQEIGEYPLGRVVDLMMGGGRCHFLPNGTDGSCRADNKDIVEMAKAKGFSYVDDRAGFDGLKMGSAVKLPLLGLFAARDIPYEIDRRSQNDVYPSLEEMTRTALKALSDATKDSEHGFFIMIEGSRIDHAGHGNDPAAQVHEVLAYDKAFTAALEFLENDSTPGVIVSTSDHETGGLATARQLHTSYPEYLWYPGVLANASHSSEYLHNHLHEYLDKDGSTAGEDDAREHIRSQFIEKGLGIYDATDAELDKLIKSGSDVPSSYVFADMISRRAQVGWTTHGHSGTSLSLRPAVSRPLRMLLWNRSRFSCDTLTAFFL
jgi:alkaline phosphatase